MTPPPADNAVAVIGLSFELPRCGDLDGLTEVLRKGTSCQGPLPPGRAAITGVTVSEQDRHVAWLTDVTGFDHRYFGLSRAEAELIDPRQRHMLRHAVGAVGNAGYSPAELRGRDVAVLVAAFGGPHPTLFDLLPEADQANGLAFTGSMLAYAAGRVAYHLDLHGPALVVDTSCSSFLVALHEARCKLARGETEVALVGGFTLLLGTPPQRTAAGEGLGVLSPADRCSPFDAAADGTALGEGGGFVVVKRLADALRDGDTVHAVIRGSAVNQDAGRRNGLTAPSPVAQAQVLAKAWRDADVDPAAIGYFEAHGTGTRIGDPIEVQGLLTALAGRPDRDTGPVISSVKGNFGHLGAMAGFAGLVRVIAQFRAGEIFPTAHFQTPNPLLELGDPPLRIAGPGQRWPATGPSLAGISGFGLSGTNAHLVVEEPPAVPTPPAPEGRQVIVLSARDEAGLRDLTARLRAAVAADPGAFDLAAAADVLALGREHLPVRLGRVVRDAHELLHELESAPVAAGGPPPALVLGFGGHDGDLAGPEVPAAAWPVIGRVVAEAEQHLPAASWSPAQRHVVRLVGLHAVLRAAGVEPDLVLAHGAGAAAARVVGGQSTLAEALAAAGDPAPLAPPDGERIGSALAGFTAGVAVLDLAPGSGLSGVLATLPGPRVTSAGTAEEMLCTLHTNCFELDWRTALGRPPRRRAELPVAALGAEPCWPAVLSGEPEPGPEDTAPSGGVEETVLALARALLKEPGLRPEDDFFERGGNSLNGTQLINRINERFGTDLGVLDLFDNTDIAALAAAVAEEAGEVVPPPVPEKRPSATLSGQQRSIWSAIQLAPASGAYNLPGAFLLDGEPDAGRVADLLEALVRRHEMFRASLEDTPDGPVQTIHPYESVPVVLEHREADLTTATGGTADLVAWLEEVAAEPLPLHDRPPTRFQLVRARFADHHRHVLMITAHHLFFDGWSWRIVLEELETGRPVPQSSSSRSYRDFVGEQQAMLAGERGQRLTRFWSGYLGGGRPVPLPTDDAPLSSSALSMAGAHLPLRIDSGLAARLQRLAQAERVTLQMVLLAAWAAQLWKISGERDVGVGTPVAGRQPADEAVIGNYVNMIVVRVHVRPEEPFSSLLAAVREASMAAHAHRDLPSDHILRAARLADAAPLATSVLNFQSGFAPLRRIAGLGPAELLDVDTAGAKFPLNMAILEYGAEFQARLKYAVDLFRVETVQAWLDEYDGLLHRLGDLQGTADLFTLFGSPRRRPDAATPPEFRF
ncbi:condensation domain-containing protein [Lentzea sp. NPDC060358]|uniref:condensation domain-containing protein n=1 Tax=Lentzea sp. NPDC060358 TaxID=3347103 RepID=UPI0036492D6D